MKLGGGSLCRVCNCELSDSRVCDVALSESLGSHVLSSALVLKKRSSTRHLINQSSIVSSVALLIIVFGVFLMHIFFS